MPPLTPAQADLAARFVPLALALAHNYRGDPHLIRSAALWGLLAALASNDGRIPTRRWIALKVGEEIRRSLRRERRRHGLGGGKGRTSDPIPIPRVVRIGPGFDLPAEPTTDDLAARDEVAVIRSRLGPAWLDLFDHLLLGRTQLEIAAACGVSPTEISRRVVTLRQRIALPCRSASASSTRPARLSPTRSSG